LNCWHVDLLVVANIGSALSQIARYADPGML
jgi:hypothetical protein